MESKNMAIINMICEKKKPQKKCHSQIIGYSDASILGRNIFFK